MADDIIRMSASLLAHIGDDANASGSGFEGQTFATTFEYLANYLDELSEHSFPELSKLTQAMVELVKKEHKISEIRVDEVPLKALKKYAENAAQEVCALKPGQLMLLPGGWYGTQNSTGHAMLYQWRRVSQDELVFEVVQSGAGLQYHPQESGTEKELHSPILSYKINLKDKNTPKAGELTEAITQFIAHISKALIQALPDNRDKQYSEDILYTELFPAISHLNADIFLRDDIPLHAYTGGQLSGTCAERVIHQLLKINFATLEAYQIFILQYKMKAINDYLEINPEPDIKLVQDTHRNNSRLFGRLLVKQALTTEQKQDLTQRLSDTKERIKRLQPRAKIARQYPASNELKTQFKIAPDALHQSYKNTWPANIAHPTLQAIQPVAPQTIDTLYTCITSCQESLKNSQWQPERVIAQLQEIMLALPQDEFANPVSYQNLTSQQIESLLDAVNALESAYKNVRPSSALPETSFIDAYFLMLKSALFDAIEYKNIGKHHNRYSKLTNAALQVIFESLKNSPYLAITNPRLDEALTHQIARIQSIPSEKIQDERVRYQAILEDFSLKDEVQKKYNAWRALNPSDNPTLHELLKKEDMAALWFAITHSELLDSDTTYDFKKLTRALCEKTGYMDVTEYAIIKLNLSLKQLNPSCHPCEDTTSFRVFEYKDKKTLYFCSPFGQGRRSLSEYVNTTDNTLYPFSYGDDCGEVLRCNTQHDSSNRIQLFTKHRTKSGLLKQREIYHLRTSPDSQIQLTLDYFIRHLTHLNDESMQLYLEANIFQPPLLLNCLKKGEEQAVLKLANKLIQRGIRSTSTQGAPTINSIYFIRLQFLITKYLMLYDAARFQSHAKAFQDTLDEMLSATPDNEHDVHHSLHLYRYLNIMAQYTASEQSLDNSEYAACLTSFLKLQGSSNASRTESAATRFELKHANARFAYLLQCMPTEALQALIPGALEAIDIPATHLKVTGEFPEISCTDSRNGELRYRIDMHRGLIYKGNENYSYGATPIDLMKHPSCMALGLNHKASCFISLANNCYTFPDETGDIRVFYYDCEIIEPVIHKKWTVNGEEAWYEQTTLHDGIDVSELPEVVRDARFSGWLKQSESGDNIPQAILLTENGRPRFIAENPEGLTEESIVEFNHLTIDDEKAMASSTNDWQILNHIEQTELLAPLLAFEDKKFLVAMYNPSTQQIKIDFERYGFVLECNLQHPEHGLTLQGTDYQLLPNESLFETQVASLMFKDRRTEAKYCMLPIQAFLKGDTDGQRNILAHDIGAKLKQEELKKSEIDSVRDMNYQLSEHMVAFGVIDNKPQVSKASDALYLAYVYLASNEHEKALEVLEDCEYKLGGLQGTTEELEHLHLLMTGPADLEQPPVVACRLRAQALLASYLTFNKPVAISSPQGRQTKGNAYFAAHRQEALTQLQEKLAASIATHFSLYQRMLRHMPAAFKINEYTTSTLLNYFNLKSRWRAYGTLGLAACDVAFKRILREKKHLESLTACSVNQLKRLDEINAELKATQDIAKVRTEIEYKAIDLSLPNRVYSALSFALDRLTFMAGRFLEYPASEQAFIENFSAWFVVARDCNSDKTLRQTLCTYCERILRQYRCIEYKNHPNHSALMANILYRLLFESEKEKKAIDIGDLAQNELRKTVRFSALLQRAHDWQSTPIYVTQPKNVYDTILKDAESLREEIEASIQALESIVIDSKALTAHESLHGLVDGLGNAYQSFKAEYIKREREYLDALKVIRDKIPENCTAEALYEFEQEAGRAEHAYMQDQNIRAEAFFTRQPEKLEQLQQETKAALNTQANITNALWQEIIKLANTLPKDEDKRLIFENELDSDAREAIGEQALYRLYIQGDYVKYRELTNLDDEQIQTLHQKMHQYMHHQLHLQQLTRVNTAVESAIRAPEDKSKSIALMQQLMQENQKATHTHTAQTFLQFSENILLRTRQVEALQSLYPDEAGAVEERVEKVIMGGGKSTVVLPLWAQTMADGSSLPIIEVPRALLHTNHTDMNQTSFKWFGQRAHKFEFSRQSDCSVKALENLYQFFHDVITNRDYLVTTGEAMQSLELKYIEILDHKPSDETSEEFKTWLQQTSVLERILNLIQSHGRAMIDEVHLGLRTKQKLNYTSGDKVHIDPLLIECTAQFYQFTSTLLWQPDARDATPIAIAEIIKNPRQIKTANEWQAIAKHIAKQAVTHESSPLQEFLVDTKLTAEQLYAYIREDFSETPEAEVIPLIHALTHEEKTRVAFYKAQLNQHNGLFKQTSSRNYRVNYGPSKLENKTPLEQVLAIPYGGNDNPRELSRFANLNESMNYTTQSLMIAGISEDLVRELIQVWQLDAETEFKTEAHNINASYQETVAARLFDRIMAHSALDIPLTLKRVDPNDESHVKAVYEACQHKENAWVIYEVLQTQVLPEITTHEEILGSNAYNHADLYRSVQCVSGTPSNHTTYHKRLKYNPKTSIGTDGLIIETAKAKQSPVRQVDYTSTHEFLEQLIGKESPHQNVHAIMDICAMFDGQENIDVATHIASILRAQHSEIQYVLYFDNEVLYAKPCNPQKPPIRLATTRPEKIKQLLGNCPPEQCFTYYDQVHTTGTDIKQSPDAKALALLDHKTTLDSCLQGTMRMRGFITGNQSVDYIVSQGLKDCEGHVEQLMTHMASEQNETIKTEVFVSALDELNNTIRRDLLNRILKNRAPTLNPAEAALVKHELLKHARNFFFTNQEEDFFQKHGATIHTKEAQKILEEHAKLLVTQWEAILKTSPMTADYTPKEQTLIEAALSHVIQVTLPHCRTMQLSRNRKEDEAAENEQEQHQETEAELELAEEQEHEIQNAPRYAALAHASTCEALRIKNTSYIKDFTKEASFFDPNFYMSKNFNKTYDGQKHIFQMHMKPAHIIYFSYDKAGTLQACLVSNDEYDKYLRADYEKNPVGWFSDLQGDDALFGEKPEGIDEDKTYQRLMAQALFFNGDIDTLIQNQSVNWLSENEQEKLSFFEQHIMPFREADTAAVNRLKSVLSGTAHKQVYSYILQNLHDGTLLEYDFKQLDSSLNNNQITGVKKLLRLMTEIKCDFSQLNTDERMNDFVLDMLKTKNLTNAAFKVIKTYVQNVKALEHTFTHFDATDEASLQVLCDILHEDLTELKTHHEQSPERYAAPQAYLLHKCIDSFYAAKPNTSLFTKILDTTLRVAPDVAVSKLRKTSRFDIFVYLAHHANENTYKQHILKAMDKAIADMQTEQVNNDPALKLNMLITTLEKKAIMLARHAKKPSDSYYQAAFEAFKLQRALESPNTQFKQNKIQKNEWAEQSKLHIQQALPKLSEHRGYKQLLLDILNCIFVILCLGKFVATGGHSFRFFKAPTDSEILVKAIESEIAKDTGAQPSA